MRCFWPALVVSILMAACGSEEHTDVKQWMKDAAKDLRGREQKLPEMKPFPAVSYNARDIVDPFRPSKLVPESKSGGGGGLKPDVDRRKEELESYPLESLKFVGVLRDGKVMYAVIAVDRKIYRKKIGNHLGQNFGQIVDIQSSFDSKFGSDDDKAEKTGKLVLRELVQDAAGDWVEQLRTMELQAQETR